MMLICGKPVPLPHLEVGGIMRGRDLDDARSELGIHQRIFDERNLAIHQRKDDELSFVLRVPFVFRIDRNGRIAEHRFRPRCSDFDELRPPIL